MKRFLPLVVSFSVLGSSLISVNVFDVSLSELLTSHKELGPPPIKLADQSNMGESIKHMQDDLRRIHEHLQGLPPEPFPARNDVLTIKPFELAARMRKLGAQASDVFRRDYRGNRLTWSAQLVNIASNDGLFRAPDGESFWARFDESSARDLGSVPIGSPVDIRVTLDLWYSNMLYVTDCRLP